MLKCYLGIAILAIWIVQASPVQADQKSEYIDFIFSHSIDHPRWRPTIDKCYATYGKRYTAVFGKGWQEEIENADSKKLAEQMKAAMPALEDPILFRADCIKRLVVLLFDPPSSLMPVAHHGQLDATGRGLVEWTYPTNQLKLRYDDLTDKALKAIEQKYLDSFAELALLKDSDYRKVQEHVYLLHEYYHTDFDYFSTSEREARSLAGPHHFHREVYLRLENSKQYESGVAGSEIMSADAASETAPSSNNETLKEKTSNVSHCKANEITLLSGTFGKKVLSFCASPDKQPYEQIEYRYGFLGKLEFTYTATPKRNDSKIFYDSVANDPSSVTNVIWFQKGTYVYAVLRCMGGNCENGKSTLLVFNGKKKLLESKCQEEFDWNLDFAISDNGSGPKSFSPILLIQDAPAQLGL